MLVFILFSIINLIVGFACAVLLGYGPDPWYALFLPSPEKDVVQIEALETDDASDDPAPASSQVESVVAEAPKVASAGPEPDPPASDPEPAPEPTPEPKVEAPEVAEPEPVEVSETVAQTEVSSDQAEEPPTEQEPSAEPTVAQKPNPTEPATTESAASNSVEDYLAGAEQEETEVASDGGPDLVSADDIEAMFATDSLKKKTEPLNRESASDTPPVDQADETEQPVAEQEEAKDSSLDQDEIAALFQ